MKTRLLIIIAFLSITSADAQLITHLSGRIVDRESEALLIVPSDKDIRHESIRIPINNGRFEYSLSLPQEEIFWAVCVEDFQKGAFRPAIFCAQGDSVYLTIIASSDFTVQSSAGNENQKITDYRNLLKQLTEGYRLDYQTRENELRENELCLSENGNKLYSKIRQEAQGPLRDSLLKIYNSAIANGTLFTPQYKALMSERDSMGRIVGAKLNQYKATTPSLYMLSITLKELMQSQYDLPKIKEIQQMLASSYARHWGDHPYYKKCIQYIESKMMVQTSGRYVDFTAPDLQGKMHRLSELIDGKIAVIDLWASWCGSCRRNSISMIPLYEKYAGDDFTIVGVAGEFKNDKALRNAISRDGYKWINLVELDRRAGIWDLYGVGNGGGKVLLVDRDGTIIAQDPSVEEIEKILLQKKTH